MSKKGRPISVEEAVRPAGFSSARHSAQRRRRGAAARLPRDQSAPAEGSAGAAVGAGPGAGGGSPWPQHDHGQLFPFRGTHQIFFVVSRMVI